jgi:hypothetical protein
MAILIVFGHISLFLFRILHLQVSASEHTAPPSSARGSQGSSGARGSLKQVCVLYIEVNAVPAVFIAEK